MQPLIRLTEEMVNLGMGLSCWHTEACLSLNFEDFSWQSQAIIPGYIQYASVYANRMCCLPNVDQT